MAQEWVQVLLGLRDLSGVAGARREEGACVCEETQGACSME